MNLSQLNKQVGTNLRLRPLPIRIGTDGVSLPQIDDQWHLERILDKPSRIRLINIATGHFIELQPDNVREYRSPDFLILRCQLTIKGPNIKIEPITGNQGTPTDQLAETAVIMQKIGTSSPLEWMYYDPEATYSYKKDVNLRIKRHPPSSSQFSEPWAHRFPDRTAHGVKFTILYGSTPIEDHFSVEVDGSRCYIPFPRSAQDLTINSWQYSFGKIINIANGTHDFDRYLRGAGIVVRD